ncbi:amino acid permease [Enterococcus sp. 2201sp1_2201st1_B8_2201SCRN_220225]|uniref:amino acid permease n=1 Tax=unclassified Enterococcus TaxID=2608891 RepID=UPI0034A54CF0
MSQKKHVSLPQLVLIITTTVYSFSSMSTAFYMMGIKSLPWFLIAGGCYFIPYALIVAQYTRKYGNRSGTVYDWLKDALSPKAAFVTAFLWYCSYFTWMVSLFMKLVIPLSILLFGRDITAEASWFGISTPWLVAGFAICAVTLLTWLINRGFGTILRFLKVSSLAMVGLLLLSAVSNFTLVFAHPTEVWANIQQGLHAPSFFEGTGDQFFSQLPFFIFAITAFGGLDTVASLSDRTKDSRRQFPKGLIYSGVIILAIYIGGIILWSGANDLGTLRQTDQMHLGNLMYGLMGSLAGSLSKTLGLSVAASGVVYQIYIRYTAFVLFTAYLGLLSSISFGPLKSLIQGTPKNLWPKQLTKLNNQEMPFKALHLQAGVIILVILAVTLNTHVAGELFNQLTYMTNVARAMPYFVVAASFPFFLKKRIVADQELFVSNRKLSNFLSMSVCACIIFAIAFQIWEPFSLGHYSDALTLIIGPIVFSTIAALLYRRGDVAGMGVE